MRKKRDEVEMNLKWNLKDIFDGWDEWELEWEAIQKGISSVTCYKDKVVESANKLYACLEAKDQLEQRIARVNAYSRLKYAEDSTNEINQLKLGRSGDRLSEVNASLSFVESEILSMRLEKVVQYMKQNEKLQPYQKWILELLEKRKHRLSDETETVLASLGEVLAAPTKIYKRSKLADMTFSTIVDDNGQNHPNSFALYENYYEFIADTPLRHKAYDSFVHTLRQYQHTFASVYETEVKRQVVTARLRNYDSVTDMLLQEQGVTLSSYEPIFEVILNELPQHMRRFIALKKRVSGVEHFRFCDLKMPIEPQSYRGITKEGGFELILESLQPMGKAYTSIMERAVKERWIDFADNIGKSTGAFCSSPYGVHPYMLFTWKDQMRSLFTFAHELGHAGHFYLTNRSQKYINSKYSRYFIEAPSTLHELLLGQHMLDRSKDRKEKRWVLSQLLHSYYHNFVTHLLEGELQRRIYRLAEKGEPITAGLLSKQKGEILNLFWGDTVEIDEGARLTWMRQPHYYMGLYPYTYAVGLTASTAVLQSMKEEGEPAIQRWLHVLKLGASINPNDLMQAAGVNMEDPGTIMTAVDYVGSLVDQLEQLYND
jgi:oligoendopeptidase F